MLLFQVTMKPFAKIGGEELLSKTELTLKGGMPQIIQLESLKYKEVMIEADFGSKPPSISLVFFPRNPSDKELLFQYDAIGGYSHRVLESGALPSKVLADLAVASVSEADKSMDIVFTTYSEQPQKFKFDGLPFFNKSEGTVKFTLQLYEPQRTTTSLYSMEGRMLCSSVDNLSSGFVDVHLEIPNPYQLANGTFYLVVDFENYGPIVKTLNSAGGAR